jgi:uncharacterized protein YbaP (TraB family)
MVFNSALQKTMFPLVQFRKLSPRILIAAISLAVGFSASAAAEKSSGGRHCLWRVTNAKASFYLLGSIHSLHDTDYPLPGVMQQAINQSQQFYFEIEPNRMDDFHHKLESGSRLPHGVEIKNKIHPKAWDYLRTTARGGNFDWVHMKAWAIALFMLDYPVHDHLSSAFGVDNYIVKKAQARNCSMRGLESAEAHAAVWTGMSDIESEAYLLQAIVYADHRDEEVREMIAAWKTGNTEKLAALDDPVVREAPGLSARFLEVRNARWIPVIENAIKSGKPTLIVAGAAHFSGSQSVIAMLRARGYQIEQL